MAFKKCKPFIETDKGTDIWCILTRSIHAHKLNIHIRTQHIYTRGKVGQWVRTPSKAPIVSVSKKLPSLLSIG